MLERFPPKSSMLASEFSTLAILDYCCIQCLGCFTKKRDAEHRLTSLCPAGAVADIHCIPCQLCYMQDMVILSCYEALAQQLSANLGSQCQLKSQNSASPGKSCSCTPVLQEQLPSTTMLKDRNSFLLTCCDEVLV